MEPSQRENRLVHAGITPILVPMALGSMRRGVDLGPETLAHGLRERWSRRGDAELLARLGNAQAIPVATLPETDPVRHPGQALHAHEIAQTSLKLAEQSHEAIARGDLALILGGDHAVAIGSVAGAAQSCQRLAVIWVDAHGDLNWPEVSPSGHVHGMPLGASLGRGPGELIDIGVNPDLRPDDVYLIGVRSLDFAERAWIREGRLHCASMADIDDVGVDVID